MSIEILQWKPANHPSIKGNFSFVIEPWGIQINDCKLITSKHGGEFIGFPSREYLDPGDNSKKFYTIVKMKDTEKQKVLQDKVLLALKEYLAKNNRAPSAPPAPEPEDDFPF
jgi:hypothetical protein